MKQRLITGIIAGAAFVGLMVLGGYAYMALVLLLALIGFHEFVRMIGLKGPATQLIGYAGLIGLTVPWDRWELAFSMEPFVWGFLFVLLVITVLSKNRITIDSAALVFTGVLYLGFGFHYMITTRLLESHGLYWSLLVFICIWATDSGAYFTGKAFGKPGKHLLWPSISPNKTVEGAVGGVAISILAACGFSIYQPELLNMGQAVLLGTVIAVVGQMGDLVQSAYKRVKGIKDTGAILPGHGGILDRVDSWLIVFPFVHLLSVLPI